MLDSLNIPISEVTDDQLKVNCVDDIEDIKIQVDLLSQCCHNEKFTPAPNLCFKETYENLRKDLKRLNVIIKELCARGIIKPFLSEKPSKSKLKG